MSSYSIQAFDRWGTVALSQTVRCTDDLDALSEGVQRSKTHAIEIWQGARLVARVKLGNAPLDAADARSL
jgi:hypothetical protein